MLESVVYVRMSSIVARLEIDRRRNLHRNRRETCRRRPCFLWIFLGAPHIEQLRGNEKVTTALSAVTAAVVGVILNLAVWFGIHVLFPGRSVDWFAVVIAAGAFLGMVRWKWDVIPVVLGAGVVGLLYKTLL